MHVLISTPFQTREDVLHVFAPENQDQTSSNFSHHHWVVSFQLNGEHLLLNPTNYSSKTTRLRDFVITNASSAANLMPLLQKHNLQRAAASQKEPTQLYGRGMFFSYKIKSTDLWTESEKLTNYWISENSQLFCSFSWKRSEKLIRKLLLCGVAGELAPLSLPHLGTTAEGTSEGHTIQPPVLQQPKSKSVSYAPMTCNVYLYVGEQSEYTHYKDKITKALRSAGPLSSRRSLATLRRVARLKSN